MSIRTLILCGDSWHAAETVRRGFLPLEGMGFEFEFLETGAEWAAEKLLDFPLVILAKANMISPTDNRVWLTSNSEREFQNHLRCGAGILVIHGGTSRYGNLTAMRRMTGGAFLSHPPQCAVTLEPKLTHKIARGLETFIVHDEHYFMTYEGSEKDVFLHSRSEHGTQPAGWTKIVDGRRVCVLTPGHNLEVWQQPEYQKILLNALRWTTNQNQS
jgi:type 1 glutamine amidotransferase